MQDEIELVYKTITHPAGFIIDLFGGLLYVRPTCAEFEVGWQLELDGQICDSYKLFWDAMEAAIFFVEKRHEMKIGIDFECVSHE